MVLTTARLTVRQFVPGDADELHAVCGDRRTMRYVGDGMTLSPRRCAEWIDESLMDYATRGYGASAVYIQGEASMAGYCGIVTARRRADPKSSCAGILGEGTVSELVPACEFGFGPCGLDRLVPRSGRKIRLASGGGEGGHALRRRELAGEEY
jgi:hypothetical protein